MRVGKIIACAAVLGCTSAVDLDTEFSAGRDDFGLPDWSISDFAYAYISEIDSDNMIGFTGALNKCYHD